MDRGALDAAIALGIPHGGWCPRGRLAEDGVIPARYDLAETELPQYRMRTEQNVVDSDATLILCRGQPAGGTELTLQLARQYGRPVMVIDPDDPPQVEEVRRWLLDHRVRVLNVAGPRESHSPGIADRACGFLQALFSASSGS